MSDPEKIKIIGHSIDAVLMPMVMGEIKVFLEAYSRQIIFTHDLEQITGFKTAMPKPVVLDLRKPTELFINHLVKHLNENHDTTVQKS